MWTAVIVVLIVLVVLFIVWRGKSREHFQILGALGPCQEDLARCLSDAEKQNPESRLSTSNIPGDRFCYQRYDTVTDRNCDYTQTCGFGDSCSQESVSDYCERVCKGNKGCMTQCACIKEVANWCANMWCPSSKMPQKDCIEQCINKHAVNCSSGRSWNWKL